MSTFQRLAQRLHCKVAAWEQRLTIEADVVVNCTPVGMHPEVDESPFEFQAFKPGAIVFDTVYNPENTLFIKLARERECQVITGVEMFVRQAALQYQLFTGNEAPVGEMRQALKRATSAVKY